MGLLAKLDPVDEEELVRLAKVAIGALLDERQVALFQLAGGTVKEALAELLDEHRLEFTIQDGRILGEFKRKEST
jgi:hypothetical protein